MRLRALANLGIASRLVSAKHQDWRLADLVGAEISLLRNYAIAMAEAPVMRTRGAR
jgi:hypothetical protein